MRPKLASMTETRIPRWQAVQLCTSNVQVASSEMDQLQPVATSRRVLRNLKFPHGILLEYPCRSLSLSTLDNERLMKVFAVGHPGEDNSLEAAVLVNSVVKRRKGLRWR